jgi:two-component system nitrogen regulation sensor histidine kinase NtrY
LTESAILQEVADGGLRVAAIANPAEGSNPEQAAAGMLDRVRTGEDVAFVNRHNRIEALTPISREEGIYLYNARDADAEALSQWERAQSVVAAYEDLTARARTLQLNFNLALFAVSLALVGLAVWFALRFADRQVRPLTELVGAARRVGEGNFSMRVEGRTGSDEIGLLNRAFNRMTAQIEQQTGDLVNANRQIENRRAFIEAVLESITAGIISIDGEGRVLLMNSSAQALLLEKKGPAPVGLTLAEIAPEIAALADAGLKSGLVQYKKGDDLLTLAVKLAPSAEGHVITFEDITRQLLDQRQAAWSDVARRIAHEIKNPLTPIQLATERLKRRYRDKINEDPELFDELTSTIVRQVGDLRKMVDEFSSFARLPKPVFRQENAVDLVRQALFLQEVARPDINFAFSADDSALKLACDRHQFGQAVTNILKNATEAIDAHAATKDVDYRGKIAVEMSADENFVEVAIADNGIGLPADRERIVEPYVTTREKGTGLGLAIVNKIVEEHGGDMHFSSRKEGGSRVTMRFARAPADRLTGSEAAE